MRRALIALALLIAPTLAFAAFWIGQTKAPAAATCTTNGSDGYAGAPTGTPQYPTILNSYAAVPSWCVAGVHYHVGYPSNISLANPSSLGLSVAVSSASGAVLTFSSVPAGVTVGQYVFDVSRPPWSSYGAITAGTRVMSKTTTTVTLTENIAGFINSGEIISFANNEGVYPDSIGFAVYMPETGFTLSGIDFSVNNGWGVYVGGTGTTAGSFGNNSIVENCNFLVGTNGLAPIVIASSAAGVTVQFNTIDGQQLTNGIGIGLISSNGVGTHLIQYNWLKNAYSETIVYGQDLSTAPTTNLTIRFNIIENSGFGYPTAHGDWIQLVNAGGNLNSATLSYNLWRQTVQAGGGGTQGLSLMSANEAGQGPTLTTTVANNVMIALGSNTVDEFTIFDTTNMGAPPSTNGTGVNSNNYMDPTGLVYWYWYVGAFNGGTGGDGPYSGTVSGSGNINMVSGATITPTNATRGYP